jgi:hypothetical protein
MSIKDIFTSIFGNEDKTYYAIYIIQFFVQ